MQKFNLNNYRKRLLKFYLCKKILHDFLLQSYLNFTMCTRYICLYVIVLVKWSFTMCFLNKEGTIWICTFYFGKHVPSFMRHTRIWCISSYKWYMSAWVWGMTLWKLKDLSQFSRVSQIIFTCLHVWTTKIVTISMWHRMLFWPYTNTNIIKKQIGG